MISESSGLGAEIIERSREPFSVMEQWRPQWQELARWVFPRREASVTGTIAALPQEKMRLFDSTAVLAAQKLASGTLENMSPMSEAWFALKPSAGLDKAWEQWFAEATKITANALQASNFYVTLHETTLDISALGTGALLVEWSEKKARMVFTALPVGQWTLEEDADGEVCCLYRKMPLTAKQVLQKFPQASEDVKKLAKDKPSDSVPLLHAVYPKEKAVAEGEPPVEGFASVYVEEKTKHVLREDWYPEQPFVVGRYLMWKTATGGLFGYAPGMEVKDDIRQVNRIQRNLDRISDRHADPPIWAPEELADEIDPNPGGVTYFSKELAEHPPQGWLPPTDVRGEVDRVNQRQETIRQAYHVGLFEMIGSREKTMTATEVLELKAEKVAAFSPTFSRRNSEFYTPLLQTIFATLFRNGAFPPVPDESLNALPYRVEYLGKLAVALQSRPVNAYYRLQERAAAQATMGITAAAENYDWDQLERDAGIAEGISPAALLATTERDKRRKEAAALAAQQQAAAAAIELAK